MERSWMICSASMPVSWCTAASSSRSALDGFLSFIITTLKCVSKYCTKLGQQYIVLVPVQSFLSALLVPLLSVYVDPHTA